MSCEYGGHCDYNVCDSCRAEMLAPLRTEVADLKRGHELLAIAGQHFRRRAGEAEALVREAAADACGSTGRDGCPCFWCRCERLLARIDGEPPP